MIPNLQFHAENLILELLNDEQDGHALGDGNLELMIDSLLHDAIQSLVNQGRIREINPHFYQLVDDYKSE